MGSRHEKAPSDLQMMLAKLSVSTRGTGLPMRLSGRLDGMVIGLLLAITIPIPPLNLRVSPLLSRFCPVFHPFCLGSWGDQRSRAGITGNTTCEGRVASWWIVCWATTCDVSRPTLSAPVLRFRR